MLNQKKTMVLYVRGNLFHSPAQVLVNTVNTVGVMGKGVALEFKRLFPEMYSQYRDLCERGELRVGQLWLYRSPRKWVLNFPTKQHWRAPSRVEYIEAGLQKFVDIYAEWGIHSIAFPPLGCGNGQLDFDAQVRPLMEQYLGPLPIDIFIYPHKGGDFVEHVNVQAMRQWLRSEPALLPFSEVWDDLKQVLARRQMFESLSDREPFGAEISPDGLNLQITAGPNRLLIHYDSLQALWQQIRTYGFSMQHIAPSLDQEMNYLIPILAELPYASRVWVAEDYESLKKAGAVGIQLLQPAQRQVMRDVASQLSLF